MRASTSSEKNYFIGRFVTGLPGFSKKKNAENKWSLLKEGIHGRQITDTLRVIIVFFLCSFGLISVVFGTLIK